MSYLRHLSAHTTRELHVFDKDSDALAVNRLQIRVFKQMRQIRLAGLNRFEAPAREPGRADSTSPGTGA